jgi:disulfide bond formation protein DsbB
MKVITNLIEKLLTCPVAMIGGVAFLSAFSLAAAYTAELAFGMEPCILCLYQRVPFALSLLVSAAVFINRNTMVKPVIAANGLLYFVNGCIAFYHTGVEQKWWVSAVEGCSFTLPGLESQPEDLLSAILKTPSVPCDVIPWSDPVLGLSMANYNVMLGLGVAVASALSLYLMQRQTR